jgi:hypothetical protein
VALCIRGTAELDFNGQAIAGLGVLPHETQRGLHLRKGQKAHLVHRQVRVKQVRIRVGPNGTIKTNCATSTESKSWHRLSSHTRHP